MDEQKGRGRGRGRWISTENFSRGDAETGELLLKDQIFISDYPDESKFTFEDDDNDCSLSERSSTNSIQEHKSSLICLKSELEKDISIISSHESHSGQSEDEKPVVYAPIPTNKIDAAHEFRMDAVPSLAPISQHFFCCICGCPAGQDCFTCKGRGHAVCEPCYIELNIRGCPYVMKTDSKGFYCGFVLLQFKSNFREFVCLNTIVGCRYRVNGCKAEGVWEVIKEHQETCAFSKM